MKIGILRLAFLIMALMASLLVLSCSLNRGVPSEKPVPVPDATAGGKPEEAGWQTTWNKLMNEARKEGKVVIYSTAPGVFRTEVGPAFKKRFGITIEDLSGRGAEIATKLLTERRAGLDIADVYIGGSGTLIRQIKPTGALDPLEPTLILPEVLDPKAWYGDALMWVDSPANTILSILAYPNSVFTINTKLVNPEDIKSYWDFVSPKYKGKIIINDPTTAGSGNVSFRVLGFKMLNLDFFKELARLEPMIVKDQRLQVEWLAQGKYSIAWGAQNAIVTDFQRAGAPLSNVIPAEGTYLTAGSGNVALINRAPHPNAARVFINWMLSREGVTLFSRAFGSHGARVDVSTEGIDPTVLRQPGVKYWLGSHMEEFQLMEPEMTVYAHEIFGNLLK